MSRAGRNFDVSRLSFPQVITVVLLVITWECDAQDNLKCTRGVCVPSYLCAKGSNNVKTDGEQLLDLRVQENECPDDMVCCGVDDGSAGNYDLLSDDRCDGECVKESDCRSGTEVINLRLRSDACGFGEVCCKNHSRVEVDQHEGCQGKCVSRNECFDHDADPTLINLRFGNSSCPANQMCCKNVKTIKSCGGLCMPRAKCAKAGMNFKTDDDRCPSQLVCCEKSTPSNHDESVKCEGKCLPASQCPASAVESINLRLSNGCSFNEVCCITAQSQNCDGTCTTMDRCADDSENYTSIDLRLTSFDCPFDQMCCKKLKQMEPLTPACDGTCVPVHQCPELNTWKSSINLRLSENNCPVKTICCKSPSVRKCDGTCVSQAECSDSTQLDLRFSTSCPFNKICCQKIKQVTPTPNVQDCNGTCVSSTVCPGHSDTTGINLRFADGSCPRNMICCPLSSNDLKNLTSDSVCIDTCLPRNQCSDLSLSLKTSCPNNQVCCKVPRLPTSCDGTCVGNDQCLDYPSINLRLSYASECPKNQICCKNPRNPQPSCKGQCVPLGKCPKESSKFGAVDLRLNNEICPSGTECCPDDQTCDGKCVGKDQCDDTFIIQRFNVRPKSCPSNQVCCRKLKIFQVSEPCDGNCVPVGTCSTGLVSISEQCSANEVCCRALSQANISASQPPNVCDGSCVPGWRCASSDVDLRVDSGICPANEVCCKTQRSPCPGECVLQENCDDVGINLRFMSDSCVKNLVCCRNVKQQTCSGQCVPANQCSQENPEKSFLDLRLANDGCSDNKVCCMTPIKFQNPTLGFEIPPPPTTPTDARCTLDPQSKDSVLKKSDVKWLVNIWKRQEILGMTRRQFACTGTLLKSDLVLTTADCVKDMAPENMFVRIDDFNLKPLATLSPRRVSLVITTLGKT